MFEYSGLNVNRNIHNNKYVHTKDTKALFVTGISTNKNEYKKITGIYVALLISIFKKRNLNEKGIFDRFQTHQLFCPQSAHFPIEMYILYVFLEPNRKM